MTRFVLTVMAAAALGCGHAEPAETAEASPLLEGRWRGVLSSPGGELPFGLRIVAAEGAWTATILNGTEEIEIPAMRVDGRSVVFDIPHYDARIDATVDGAGTTLEGEWTKRKDAAHWRRLPFRAHHGIAYRFEPHDIGKQPEELDGRWHVRFASSDQPAVGLFDSDDDLRASGTFLTSTGDYRYLAGSWENGLLRLSCFDGAHAFLFHARYQPDGSLKGDFWSADSWHETWTAKRSESIDLDDPFRETKWTGNATLGEMQFPDLDGRLRSLDDPAFRGKARILQVFGSWCPNCHDASRFLVELHEKYGPRGLAIVGVGFELTGEFERDAAQVRTYAKRHGVTYPLLVSGPADKGKATEVFKLLDRVRSYPTTVFLHEDGRVRAIHTGFTGPATGEAYAEMREQFERIIEELLAE